VEVSGADRCTTGLGAHAAAARGAPPRVISLVAGCTPHAGALRARAVCVAWRAACVACLLHISCAAHVVRRTRRAPHISCAAHVVRRTRRAPHISCAAHVVRRTRRAPHTSCAAHVVRCTRRRWRAAHAWLRGSSVSDAVGVVGTFAFNCARGTLRVACCTLYRWRIQILRALHAQPRGAARAESRRGVADPGVFCAAPASC
jgi:hypothetical protein